MKEVGKSIPSKVRNGRTMKDDRGDFSRNIWNQSFERGMNEGSKACCKEMDQAAPLQSIKDRVMVDGRRDF